MGPHTHRLDGWENSVFEDVILSASGNNSWLLIFATYDSLYLHGLVTTPHSGIYLACSFLNHGLLIVFRRDRNKFTGLWCVSRLASIHNLLERFAYVFNI